MTAEPWSPVGLVLLSSTSLQVGLAVAATTFAEAGPASAVWVRSVVGAALLGLTSGRASAPSPGPDRPGRRLRAGARVHDMFAYLAICQAPLGVVSAILMLGPLAIAAWGNRTPLDLALVGIAAAGALTLSLAEG